MPGISAISGRNLWMSNVIANFRVSCQVHRRLCERSKWLALDHGRHHSPMEKKGSNSVDARGPCMLLNCYDCYDASKVRRAVNIILPSGMQYLQFAKDTTHRSQRTPRINNQPQPEKLLGGSPSMTVDSYAQPECLVEGTLSPKVDRTKAMASTAAPC